MAWLPGLARLDVWSRSLVGQLAWNALAAVLVAVVVWSILRFWRSASPRWRVALWTLVFLRLVIPAGWSHALSLRAGFERLQASVVLAPDPSRAPTIDTAPTGLDEAAGSGGALGVDRAASLASIALIAWAAGALVAFARYRVRLSAFRRDARGAPAVESPSALALVQRWRARFRIRRSVRLVAIAGPAPYTLGVLHPVVAIPRRFLQAGYEGRLEPIIAHELAHVRRWDAAALAVQNLLHAVYFFNPAIWIADRHLNLARECMCDGMVLAHGTLTPFDYGEGLLAVLRNRAGGPCGEVPTMGLTRSQWTTRVAGLRRDHREPPRERIRIWVVSAAVVAVVFPMGAAPTGVPRAPDVPPRSERVRPAVTVEATTPQAETTMWASPVPSGRLTSGFGERRSPETGRVELHTGVDLAAPVGTPVLAAADGTVGFPANPETGAAKPGLVRVTHDQGYATYYSVLSAVAVTDVQRVKRGDAIGIVGTSEGGTGPHLHFVIMKDGKAIDPERLIQFNPAR